MNARIYHVFFILSLLIGMLVGCASFRSGMEGGFQGEPTRNVGARQVSVLFIFSHVRQTLGYDAVPKLEDSNQILTGFDDIFIDAMREFSNINEYATYTEYASDVNHPERRAQRDSLIASNDYTVHIRLKSEKRFAPYFLKTLMSSISVTLLPLPYTRSYGLEAEVRDRTGKLVATVHRSAKLTKWVQTLLIFVYPFCPEERKREEIYLEFLRDAFRQIESERVFSG